MPHARVLRKGQLTLPKKVRDTLNVKEGDIIDFEIDGSVVTIKPQVLVEKKEGALLASLRRMQEKVGDVGPDEMSALIEEAIREVRRDKRGKGGKA